MLAKVEVQMMIRRPVEAVFAAFMDPGITSKFWFSRSSGAVEEGKVLRWEWEKYGAVADVYIETVIKDELIKFKWGEPQTTVEFRFRALDEAHTYLQILNYGFQEDGEALWRALMDNTGGFTTVVDAAKAWLEHGLVLNLVNDKFNENPH
jgi:uncharacterized protein YndB with AHSA1/START domain